MYFLHIKTFYIIFFRNFNTTIYIPKSDSLSLGLSKSKVKFATNICLNP